MAASRRLVAAATATESTHMLPRRAREGTAGILAAAVPPLGLSPATFGHLGRLRNTDPDERALLSRHPHPASHSYTDPLQPTPINRSLPLATDGKLAVGRRGCLLSPHDISCPGVHPWCRVRWGTQVHAALLQMVLRSLS